MSLLDVDIRLNTVKEVIYQFRSFSRRPSPGPLGHPAHTQTLLSVSILQQAARDLSPAFPADCFISLLLDS